VIDKSIEGLTLIRFDMSDLKYLSSAGLRVLMNTQKKMNEQGSMKVVGANETIMEVFDMTGLCDVFDIE
jgi:anti-sigma B factor antagonist